MIRSDVNTILFDLDGTLLPMEIEAFTNKYFEEISKKAVEFGYDAKETINSVWTGTKEMIKNDGSVLNIERFWDSFVDNLGEKALELKEPFDKFYREEFHNVREATTENPLAKKLIGALKDKGYTLILATNPLFPADATRARMGWIELSEDDFELVTTYDNSSYCKPNPEYYKEILEKIGKDPNECIMIGNDAVEDVAAKQAGLEVYLVTDCLDNPKNVDISDIEKGSFEELFDFLGL